MIQGMQVTLWYMTREVRPVPVLKALKDRLLTKNVIHHLSGGIRCYRFTALLEALDATDSPPAVQSRTAEVSRLMGLIVHSFYSNKECRHQSFKCFLYEYQRHESARNWRMLSIFLIIGYFAGI
ncbi:hypothetical protein MKW92_026904 [Papaver armeniacum]|nr:hypothetical protein MKW92_026904 [Papaver armeniacum]